MEKASNDFLATPGHLDDRARTNCRAVLRYFRGRSTAIATVDELVTFVRDREQPDADEARVAIHLHHATLPRLADAGLVDYDARSNTARYRGLPTENR